MTSLVKSNKSTFDLLLIVFFHLRLRRKIQIGLVFILIVNQWCYGGSLFGRRTAIFSCNI